MENYPTRSFFGLGIFVFFLYFIKVSSVLNDPTTRNIIDVIKSDKELCLMPTFLYENNITGECHNVTYPEGNHNDLMIMNPRDTKFLNTILCLAFYDTWYKVCSNQLQKSFNNGTTFQSHLQTFFPGGTPDDQTLFCKNIKDIKFVHKKLKPLLSLVHFNNSHVCYSACFDFKENFVPLCAVLAWSKSIDDNIHPNTDKKLPTDLKPNTEEQTQFDNIYSETAKKVDDNTDKNKEQTANAKKTDDAKTYKHIKTPAQKPPQMKVNKPLVTKFEGQNTTGNVNISPLSQQKQVETSVEKSHISEKVETTSKDNQKPEDSKKFENTDANVSEKLETSSKKEQKLEESKKVENVVMNISEKPETLPKNDEKPEESKKSENTNADTNVNNGVEENTNDAKDIEDIKTNTISENTQDHENSANQDDWSHTGDEKLPNGPNDGADQSIDAADQGQNIPEPSEQRDIISHYHGIKTDEESHFFAYFTVVSLSSIAAYIGYHNKQKILAIVLEGRRSRNSRGRRRPSTANYRKLDCTLEEAVTSQCNANVTHVIY